jgi:hypothetical protein
MAITKIVTPELFDFSSLNTALQLPTGTTAERPGTLAGTLAPVAGEWRYNTTLSYVEYYDGTSPYDAAKWFQIDDEALPATCTTDTINYPTGTTNTAYYKMSDATDSTLNGYNGTATDVDFNVQGKFGNAGEFNGTSSKINTGYIQNGQVYSVSFWAKNLSANGSVLRDTPAAGGANTFMDIATGANGQVIIAGNAALDPLNTPSTDWINYVVVLDGTNATIFTNGSQTATITYTAKSGNNGTPVHIMSNGAYPVGFASGSIDQVRIFPTALTLGNVTSLHNEVQCVPAIIPSDIQEMVVHKL